MIKLNNTDKIKVFTHTDLDGIGAVLILQTLLQNNTQVHYECHNYDTIDQAIIDYQESKEYLNYTQTYITDISVKDPKAMQAITNIWTAKPNIALFDHHKTAEHLNNKLWAKVNTEGYHCGTSLFFDYLLSKHELLDNLNSSLDSLYKLMHAVDLIRSYDTWEWVKTDNEKANQLNQLFNLKGPKKFLEDIIHNIHDDDLNLISLEDLALLDIEVSRMNRYIKSKIPTIIELPNQYKNFTAGLVYAEQYVSELGHKILQYNKNLDYVMIVDMTKKAVSLRSRENGVNVREIAELNLGGGHTNSAGYRLKTNTDRTIQLWL